MDLELYGQTREEQIYDNMLSDIVDALKNNADELTFDEKNKLMRNLKNALITGSKSELQSNVAQGQIFRDYDFIRVLSSSPSRQIYYKHKMESVYHILDDTKADLLVRDAYLANGIPYQKSKVNETRDTLKLNVKTNIDTISNRVIKMGNFTFWDTHNHRVVNSLNKISLGDGPNGEPICMRQLFDSSPHDRIKVNIDDVMFDQDAVNEVVKYLTDHNGIISLDLDPETLAPFDVWSNGDNNTLNDLIKAIASIFFENKIKGAYFLIGETRNGKSSFIKLIHTMMGSKNTSKVEQSAVYDYHRNSELIGSMVNAPDEEADGRDQETKEGQHLFKSMASHDPITIPVMYSSESQEVSTDFMGFYPSNRMPTWTGDGVQALVSRVLPLFFTKDLSNYDKSGKNFEAETYTAQFFSRFLPIVLGVVTYWKDKELTFSPTLYENRETVKTIVDPFSIYFGLLKSYFHSIGSVDFLIEDYIRWMTENAYTYTKESLKMAKQRIQRMKKAQVRYSNGLDGSQGRKTAYWFIADQEQRPEHRIKTFQDDSIMAALGDRTPIDYLRYCNEKDLPHRSIVSVFEEMKQDGTDPITLQEDREKYNFFVGEIKDGRITDQGELEFD